jgi:hypothetical protein
MRQWSDGPVAVVVMGVSGAGKSAVGQQLAKRLGWNFVEGDALHSPENVAKMKSGQPLSDADRAPWLAAIGQIIEDWQRRGERGVITCSALKQAYRRQIIGGHDDIRLLYLSGTRELIAAVGGSAWAFHAAKPARQPIRHTRAARTRRESDHRRDKSIGTRDREQRSERSLFTCAIAGGIRPQLKGTI